MMRSVYLALMEAENARRAAERSGRAALHPLAQFHADWERARALRKEATEKPATHFSVSLTGDDE